MGVLIGVTFEKRPIQPEWSIALVHLIGFMPINTPWGLTYTRESSIDVARIAIAEHAQNDHAEFVFYLDDDTAPPHFALMRLMKILDENKDAAVAAGIYFTKTTPTMPVVGRKDGGGPSWDWKLGDVFDADILGTGCMLVRTSVFDHIQRPWFKVQNEVQPNGDMKKASDDVYFLRKVRAAGYRTMADGGTIPTHWDVATGKAYTAPEDFLLKK